MTASTGRALFIGAHPDDADFLAGGTVARLVKDGRETAYVVVTNGNKGSSDASITPERLIALREAEQRDAARVLGVTDVVFLGYEDGELEDSRDLRRDVTREIRRWRPDLVITLSPHRTYTSFPGWHRDHRTTARVVLDCVYPLARDRLAFPELLPEFQPHKVSEVYTIQWEQPSLIINITETMDQKLEAMRRHVSQVADIKAFEERLRNRAATLGKDQGYSYAEGFDHIVVPG
jgi:LmbE family N-acetylglucosaminyl deacetylase